MLREWIRTFAEFPTASFLFGAFILAMTILTGFWVEAFLMNIASVINAIATVRIERKRVEELVDDDR